MYTEKILSFLIDHRIYDKLYKGYVLRAKNEDKYDSNNMSCWDWIWDRIRLLGYTIGIPFFCLLKKERISLKAGEKINIIIGSNKEAPNWKSCINYYFNQDAIQINIWNGIVIDYKFLPLAFLWWIKFILISFLSLFDCRKIPFRHLIHAWNICIEVLLSQSYIDNIYIYYLPHHNNYLVGAFINKNKIATLNLMLGSNDMFIHRYLYFDLSHIFFMSKIQEEEWSYYRKKGEVLAKTEVYIGSGDICEFVDDQNMKEIVDIGFFSTGYWARSKTGQRVGTLGQIDNNKKQGNVGYEYEKRIFLTILDYAKEHNLSVKYYPHPYEREIWRAYGLLPPLSEYVDDITVFCDDMELQNSHKALGEPVVAVSGFSSSIFQRIDRGYKYNLLLQFDRIIGEKMFEIDSMGSYKDIFFIDMDELIFKLRRIWNEINKTNII